MSAPLPRWNRRVGPPGANDRLRAAYARLPSTRLPATLRLVDPPRGDSGYREGEGATRPIAFDVEPGTPFGRLDAALIGFPALCYVAAVVLGVVSGGDRLLVALALIAAVVGSIVAIGAAAVVADVVSQRGRPTRLEADGVALVVDGERLENVRALAGTARFWWFRLEIEVPARAPVVRTVDREEIRPLVEILGTALGLGPE